MGRRIDLTEKGNEMNKRMMSKLESLMRKYASKPDDESAMLNQTAFAISEGLGTWCKDGKPFGLSWFNLEGESKCTRNAIFWRQDSDGLVAIKRHKNGKLYAFNDSDFQCQITDQELIGIIDELSKQ